MSCSKSVVIWAAGERGEWFEFGSGKPVYFAAAADGSGMYSAGGSMMTVDYSGASGVDALVVLAGCPVKRLAGGNSRVPDLMARYTEKLERTQFHPVPLGRQEVMVITISESGGHPTPAVNGETIVVGGQSISIDGVRFRLAKFGKPVEEFTGDTAGWDEAHTEQQARVFLRRATQLAGAGRAEPAKPLLSRIVKDFPETNAAQQARELLFKLP